ncbi:MAG: hypothetical protein A2081_05075 [Elusimicrobia bacterium GWC2_61_19]|nr:MAG: hypothetical protein A2081_05075 [Elusimicrobia bacterium GWC2_61_19]
MKRTILLLPALVLLAACAGGKKGLSLTSEPSIERAFDTLEGTREGRPLLKFLRKHPVRFEYANTAGLCHKFSLRTGKIFLPPDYKGSDKVLAVAVARAAYIYKLYSDTGLDEIIAEDEELSALLAARLAVDLEIVDGDFKKVRGAESIKASFCAYLLNGPRYAMEQARKQALSADSDCQRPLDTLEGQRVWLERMRKAIKDDTFYQLLYDRDQLRVKRGALTMNQAMKNDAQLRGLPSYEMYRYQRTFYDVQSDIVDKFEKIRTRELAQDAGWRRAEQAALDGAREEFSDCVLPE